MKYRIIKVPIDYYDYGGFKYIAQVKKSFLGFQWWKTLDWSFSEAKAKEYIRLDSKNYEIVYEE